MDLSSLPSILTPDLGLLFWMLLAFLVVFFVLAKFGFPAITVMVEKRKNYIDESLKKAHEASLKLENIKQESEAILQEAREESARIISEAKAEIEAHKQAAISDIRKQVAILSVEVSEKILRKNLDTDKAQMDYIDLMLNEVNLNK